MSAGQPAAFIYFDANPLMYAFEAEIGVAAPVRSLLAALRGRPGLAVTSELTLAELLAPVRRKGVLPQEARRRLYLDLLVWGDIFQLRPVSRDVLIDTAALREIVPLKRPDAVHVVTAQQAGCTFMLSNDGDVKRLPEGLTRVRPTRGDIDLVLDRLP